MRIKECTEYHEPPITHSDDPSNSDDIEVLKVFQNILAHRSYIQGNYKLGKVSKYHDYVLPLIICSRIQNIFINFFQYRLVS